LKRSSPDPRAQAKRAALNALRRAQRKAAREGVTLSPWEDEFLGSVADRVKTYGRAFGDPEKGAPGQALSALQAVKLKEIAAKAGGEKKMQKPRSGFSRARPKNAADGPQRNGRPRFRGKAPLRSDPSD
jgi:hypothetical protein